MHLSLCVCACAHAHICHVSACVCVSACVQRLRILYPSRNKLSAYVAFHVISMFFFKHYLQCSVILSCWKKKKGPIVCIVYTWFIAAIDSVSAYCHLVMNCRNQNKEKNTHTHVHTTACAWHLRIRKMGEWWRSSLYIVFFLFLFLVFLLLLLFFFWCMSAWEG